MFAVLADVLRLSRPSFGLLQASMLVIGGIVSLFSLRRLLVPEQYKWDWLFVMIYLSGILFVGLRPDSVVRLGENVFLYMGRFNLEDFYVNMIGFAPLGFLMMAALAEFIKTSKSIVVTVLLAVMVSTLIEYLQFCCVYGRYSSGYDVLSNVFAVALGVAVYLAYDRLLSSGENE